MKQSILRHTLLLACLIGLVGCAGPQAAEKEVAAETPAVPAAQANAFQENAVNSAQNYFIAEDGTQLHAQSGEASYDAAARTLTIALSKPVGEADATRTDTYTITFKDIDFKPGVYTRARLQDGDSILDALEIKELSAQHLVGAHYRIRKPHTTASNDSSAIGVAAKEPEKRKLMNIGLQGTGNRISRPGGLGDVRTQNGAQSNSKEEVRENTAKTDAPIKLSESTRIKFDSSNRVAAFSLDHLLIIQP